MGELMLRRGICRSAFQKYISRLINIKTRNIRKLNAFNLLHVEAGGTANKVLNPRAAQLVGKNAVGHIFRDAWALIISQSKKPFLLKIVILKKP